MATSGGSAKRRRVAACKGPTANQLGFRTNTLVLYKNNPYHIVCIGSRGDTVSIKKCTNPNTIRDNVDIDRLTMVDFKDPLYSKWGLVPQKADFARTREDELYTIKAMVQATRGCGKEARRDVVIEVMKRNGWLGVWLRACYDEDRKYRLLPEHLRHVKRRHPRNDPPESIFTLLTKLQFKKIRGLEAAIAWVSMLESMHEEVWGVANMMLTRQFGTITYADARFAMKETKCVPWLPKKETSLSCRTE